MLKLWKRTFKISRKQLGANQHIFTAFFVPSHAKYYVVSQLKTNFCHWVTLGDLLQALFEPSLLYMKVSKSGAGHCDITWQFAGKSSIKTVGVMIITPGSLPPRSSRAQDPVQILQMVPSAQALLFFFFKEKWFFYWSIVDLQYCVSFRHTAKWFSYTYIFFQIIFHHRLLQDTQYSLLCFTVNPCYLPILYIVVCICSSHAPSFPLPPLPLW